MIDGAIHCNKNPRPPVSNYLSHIQIVVGFNGGGEVAICEIHH